MNRIWDQYIAEEWSKEARAAAIAARQKRAGGSRVGGGLTKHKEYSKSMGSRFKSVGNKLKSAFGMNKKPSVYKPKPLTNSILAAKQAAREAEKKRAAEREREDRIFSKYGRI